MFPNLLVVLGVAVASFVTGFLLHGPIGGKLWMKLADVHPTGNEKFSDMYGQMFWNLVTNFVTAYALGAIYLIASSSSVVTASGTELGIYCGLLVWIGFQVPMSAIEVIWMKRSVKLWLYEAVCALVAFVAMGAIIAHA
jgi:hypothetical protein